MNTIYFDNAATSPMYPEVLEAMMPYFQDFFGNPSSTHKKGREVKAKLEQARKEVARCLNATASEIFFTSCATEANNTILKSVVKSYGTKHIISSSLEHHAVLYTLHYLEAIEDLTVHYVKHDSKGVLDLEHLKELLEKFPNALVTIMHGNNEIGNLNPIKEIAELCQKSGAFFHSDTVQTIGHYALDVQELGLNALVGSAHKFHGPKGVGVLYLKAGSKLHSFIHGGAQERGFRAGTENIAGIIGLSEALSLTYQSLDKDKEYISSLKAYLIEQLRLEIEGVEFNGSEVFEESLYSLINISLPPLRNSGMLLFNLDLNNISVSSGSACSSGAQIGSHVLQALEVVAERPSIRCSFSKFNTKEEIDFFVKKLASLY
ncbi:MAG: cysteine desulfurase [Cytophagales bacterium]|nr:cysteine desulfurase [Cytophagales bacterium]